MSEPKSDWNLNESNKIQLIDDTATDISTSKLPPSFASGAKTSKKDKVKQNFNFDKVY